MVILFRIFLFILGACLGSFLCCQARRFRLKEQKKKSLGNRSVCLSCHKKLKWYDNLPIISWIMLKGKCRHCHKRIGLAELLSELGTALSFTLLSFNIDIFIASSMDWAIFVATLLLTTILIFLAIYDGLYGELPTTCLMLAIGCAIAILSFRIFTTISSSGFAAELIWKPLVSFLILGGIYLALYLVSKGRWVGAGDSPTPPLCSLVGSCHAFSCQFHCLFNHVSSRQIQKKPQNPLRAFPRYCLYHHS